MQYTPQNDTGLLFMEHDGRPLDHELEYQKGRAHRDLVPTFVPELQGRDLVLEHRKLARTLA